MKTKAIKNETMPRTAHDLLPGDTADQYKAAVSEYDQQAQDFLSRHGLKFRATLSNSKTAPWDEDGEDRNHYRITLSKRATYRCALCGNPTPSGVCEPCIACGVMDEPAKRLVFDFWGSVADARKGVTTATAYDVLACISGDAYTPETFADYCAEYGYESDSIKVLQQFRRCDRFAKRLRAFFTEAELQELAKIQ